MHVLIAMDKGEYELRATSENEESREKVGYVATLERVTWWTGKEGWVGGESTCGNW